MSPQRAAPASMPGMALTQAIELHCLSAPAHYHTSRRPGMPPNIVVVGSSNSDLTLKLPTIPAPGEAYAGGDVIRALGACRGMVGFARKVGNATVPHCQSGVGRGIQGA